MRENRLFLLVVFLAAFGALCPAARADDYVVMGTVTGTHTISSDEGIVFDAATIDADADVIADSTYEVHLGPGTRIADGARFSVQMRDNDGLSNRCEITYFGDLTHNPGDDDDTDGLTNTQECQLGYNPNDTNMDNDGDGLLDEWEFRYFGLFMANEGYGRDGDPDGDGISNYIEYRLGLDPSLDQNLRPGVHYQYDDLGRVIKIQRIPGR